MSLATDKITELSKEEFSARLSSGNDQFIERYEARNFTEYGVLCVIAELKLLRKELRRPAVAPSTAD